MGSLNYASTAVPIEMDDRLLAHVRTVAVTKLRRGESFALTVPKTSQASETLWLHASIPLRFDVADDMPLDRELLTAMMTAANSSGGLDLTNHRITAKLPRSQHLQAMSA
ncbi:hypothetical protein [Microbacterium sp. 179-I 3D3 NHS]|uniref:DUF7882 family protein n=1 Tax=unclassified Microbacterium TaxID=2609290 RepID=UPI0039A05FB4